MTTRIKVNNLDINYRIEGPDDGPVVMLSNSLMSNVTMWDDQVEALTSAYLIIPHSAHLPNIEQTEAFNKALVNYLDEQH